MSDQVFELPAPITHGSETITELVFKPLTPKLINELGMPFRFEAGSMVPMPIPAVCLRYASRLCGVPPSVIEKIPPKDYLQLCYMIVGFFGDSDAQPSES